MVEPKIFSGIPKIESIRFNTRVCTESKYAFLYTKHRGHIS